jgi:hypothetical protein
MKTKNGLQIKMIGFIISLVIVFMASANGIFTYSGAYLYLQEHLFAILFAVAIQFTIIVSLLALPFVHGLGKMSLITVYTAALIISTLSAFTFIYNESLPEETTTYTIDTEQKAKITTLLSDVVRAENELIRSNTVQVNEYKRLMNEEARNGGRSGEGPGKGPIFYQKLDKYENAKAELDLQKANYDKALRHLEDINTTLANKPSDDDRQKLLVNFSQLRSLVNDQQSQKLLENISTNYLAELQNPVQRALTAMLDYKNYSIQLFVSIVWAAVFDIIALFLGIIRYYLLRPDYSIWDNLHSSLVGSFVFMKKLRHLPQEARLTYHRESGVPMNKHEVPLNSADMQNFATKLLAGSQMAAAENEDPAKPLQKLVGFIEPVDVAEDPHAIGICYEKVDENPELKTLLAMLVQTQVFKNDSKYQCYTLNNADNYAQKVMVFLRMGMKENPADTDVVAFLTKEQKHQQEQIALQTSPPQTSDYTDENNNSEWGNKRSDPTI